MAGTSQAEGRDDRNLVIAKTGKNKTPRAERGDLLMVLPKIPSLGTSILVGITCLRRISGRQAIASLLRNDVFNISQISFPNRQIKKYCGLF